MYKEWLVPEIADTYCCKRHHDSNRIISISYNSSPSIYGGCQKCVCSLDCKYSHIHDAINSVSPFCKCNQKTVSDITLGKIGRFHRCD